MVDTYLEVIEVMKLKEVSVSFNNIQMNQS